MGMVPGIDTSKGVATKVGGPFHEDLWYKQKSMAYEWQPNTLPAWIHTKHELTPGSAEALTKWLTNGSEVMYVERHIPTEYYTHTQEHGYAHIKS
jgi:hypothetical protein